MKDFTAEMQGVNNDDEYDENWVRQSTAKIINEFMSNSITPEVGYIDDEGQYKMGIKPKKKLGHKAKYTNSSRKVSDNNTFTSSKKNSEEIQLRDFNKDLRKDEVSWFIENGMRKNSSNEYVVVGSDKLSNEQIRKVSRDSEIKDEYFEQLRKISNEVLGKSEKKDVSQIQNQVVKQEDRTSIASIHNTGGVRKTPTKRKKSDNDKKTDLEAMKSNEKIKVNDKITYNDFKKISEKAQTQDSIKPYNIIKVNSNTKLSETSKINDNANFNERSSIASSDKYAVYRTIRIDKDGNVKNVTTTDSSMNSPAKLPTSQNKVLIFLS